MQDSVFRDAFLKALTPTILVLFTGLVALLPLYAISQSYLSRSSQPLPVRPLK